MSIRYGLSDSEMREFLDDKVRIYNSPAFIEADPISIPHSFKKKEDIEISAFLAATIAWGNRKAIVKSATQMMLLMEFDPHNFVMHSTARDHAKLKKFVHRTFNGDDFVQFIKSLRHVYSKQGGMEMVFEQGFQNSGDSAQAISAFRNEFFNGKHLQRSRKHVSNPLEGSSAKRLNMFLRWMVRSDQNGVDFGIWKGISMSKLSLPLDVHTGNVARKLFLLQRRQNDWKAVQEVTERLRNLDPQDPVKYDFALFGLGAIENF